MSARYQKPYIIPDGFPSLLKSFTREVLRSQPDNIYEFGARYFAELLHQRQEGPGEPAAKKPQQQAAPAPAEAEEETAREVAPAAGADAEARGVLGWGAGKTDEELQDILLQLFYTADKDRSGSLDRTEFKVVLENSELGLSARSIRRIHAETDENDDGLISYSEFVPMMIQVVSAMSATEHARTTHEVMEGQLREEVEQYLFRGMTKEQLETMVLQAFRKADVDGSGALDRKEFKACLRSADLGLTRKEINTLMANVDLNKDSLVSYEEFVPLCHEILVQHFIDQSMEDDVLDSPDKLEQLLYHGFQEADPDGTRHITLKQMQKVLQQLSWKALGITRVQILAVVAAAPVSGDGSIDYMKFVPEAAAILHSMLAVEGQKERAVAVKKLAETGAMQDLSTQSREQLVATLREAFLEADKDESGTLTGGEAVNAIMCLADKAGEQLSFLPSEWQALALAIDSDSDDVVQWEELVDFLTSIMSQVERERLIQSMATGAAPTE